MLQEIVWQPGPARGHEIDGLYGTQCNHVIVSPAITHDAHGSHRQEYRECLAGFVVEIILAQLFDEYLIGKLQQGYVFGFHFAKNAYPQSGARERVSIHHCLRQSEFQADLANFVFKKFAQRLDQFHAHFFRQAANVVM